MWAKKKTSWGLNCNWSKMKQDIVLKFGLYKFQSMFSSCYKFHENQLHTDRVITFLIRWPKNCNIITRIFYTQFQTKSSIGSAYELTCGHSSLSMNVICSCMRTLCCLAGVCRDFPFLKDEVYCFDTRLPGLVSN